jgi:voltage-gated sodium channel
METSKSIMARWGEWLVLADHFILAVFVVEIALRLAVHRWAFFRDPWSVFDFIVVGIALLPAAGPFAVLRALRVLRVLRLLTMVPSMRRVVSGLLAAIPGLSSVVAIIGIIFYVNSVIATKLFAERFPDWFGTLGGSAYTLFQVMTLESWSMGIVRPVLEVYPYAWIFFITFILISTFTMLNLFIAVIVNAIQSENQAQQERTQEVVTARVDEDASALQRELSALRQEVRELKQLLAGRI